MYLFRFLLFASSALLVAADCNCGHYDPSTGNVFTERLILYFNETTNFPAEVLSIQTYEDGYEKGWNSRYRNGANASNVGLAASRPSKSYQSSNSLELALSPSDKKHLVMGGGVRSLRQDIQYGSFRSLIRPSQPWLGGSAMSMNVEFNETQSIRMSSMNADTPDAAWVNTLLADEFPNRNLGINFTVLLEDSRYAGISPWEWMEYRYDWLPTEIDFYVQNVLTRSATEKNVTRKKFPSTPSALYFKHWSNGDPYAMGGPPENRTIANIGWARAFFNSSAMSKSDHEKFDSLCHATDACSMDDITLRGYSEWPEEALSPYKPTYERSSIRMFAVWVLSLSVAMTMALLFNILYQRWPPRTSRQAQPEKFNFCRRLPSQMALADFNSDATTLASAAMTPANLTRPSSLDNLKKHIDDMRPSRFDLAFISRDDLKNSAMVVVSEREISSNPSATPSTNQLAGSIAASVPTPMQPLAPTLRVDYLAGLISVSTIIVTLIHFSFTFVPAAAMPAEYHYRSEVWAMKLVAPFLLNQVFVGAFFITSTRFLIEKYLKKGDLLDIAGKTAGRTFRVMIPIAAIAMLQYFLIDCGAIMWLEYLPSVTWSTWPYAVVYTDFSHYLSEVLGLVYLIPNAAPQITYNYCTGVLWTIPVQLQGSWQTLLGALVIYEIKNPYKRGAFYVFCILMNWYAQAWGSFFWFGILLADLDVTYHYKTYLHAPKRRRILYPILWVSFVCAIGGLSDNLIAGFTGKIFPIYERGIHPDILTGLPIYQTIRHGYPDYFAPRLDGLTFSVGLQVLVELSPRAQAVFSIKPFLIIFPHIFTIYLLHGFVFWSLGSTIAVHLNAFGWPYWANILAVGLSCYTTLFAALPLLTPVVDTLGKNVTVNIWIWLHETTFERKGTLFPFREDLLIEEKVDEIVMTSDEESSKGKGKEKEIERDEKSASFGTQGVGSSS